jgi:hypothetical protein
MKRLNLALPAVALMCALATSPGHAAAWLGGTVGVGLPTSDFGDAFKSGWNLGATGDYMLAPMWGLGGDLGYMDHHAKDEVNSTPPPRSSDSRSRSRRTRSSTRRTAPSCRR